MGEVDLDACRQRVEISFIPPSITEVGGGVKLNNQHLLPVLRENGQLFFANSPPHQPSHPQELRTRTA